MSFCLMPQAAEKFKAAITDGTVDPYKLNKMTSEERRGIFEGLVGKDVAKEVNSAFESKILLKNQKYAYTTWAKKVAGLTPETRRDLISRIERIDHILNPEEEKMFLKDLASTKLGVDVTQQEAKTISELSQNVQKTGSNMKSDYNFNSESERLAHGAAIRDLQDYVADLKSHANRTLPSDLYKHPVKSFGRAAGVAKSLKATLDNSVIGRQGIKVLFTNPTVWARNSRKTFVDMWKELGGKNAMNEVRADVLSRPNALNGLYKKEGLDLGVVEEAYPSHFPGKIKGVGRVFKASESAFTGFQYRTRADLFDKYVDIAKKADGDTKGLGLIANSLTGRGALGSWERNASKLNNIFFSPRLVKSNFDTLTGHASQAAHGKLGATAKRQAAQNMLKVMTGIASILTIANAIKPGSVEFDPRSADFGKIKIGDTRFDVTGGMSSLATLIARGDPVMRYGGIKSSSGKITKLNSGKFGSKDVLDLFESFAQNKFSPAASVINDIYLRGTDFKGNKPTLKGEAANLTIPLSATTFNELKNDPNGANKWAGLIADGLGISVNTYGNTPAGTKGVTKELSQTLTKAQFTLNAPDTNQRGKDLNPTQYKSFTNEADQLFINSVNKARNDPTFQNYSQANQNKALTSSLTAARKKALDDVLGKQPKQKTVRLRKY